MKKYQAVVLASGVSRRLGFNKLFVRIDGETVIARSVRPFLEAGIERVLVVAGRELARFEEELRDLPAKLVHNPHFAEGMSASVRAVLPFLGAADGVFFHLGDKPFVAPDLVRRMAEVFESRHSGAVVPVCGSVWGHPVLVRNSLYGEEMAAIRGDRGLREVIEKHGEDVVFIEGDEGILLDIDTLEQIEGLRKRGYRVEES
jgi:molybdenum cofactor cytidylyltransferase